MLWNNRVYIWYKAQYKVLDHSLLHALLTLLLSPGDNGGLSFDPAFIALVLLLSDFLVNVDRRLCTGAVNNNR